MHGSSHADISATHAPAHGSVHRYSLLFHSLTHCSPSPNLQRKTSSSDAGFAALALTPAYRPLLVEARVLQAVLASMRQHIAHFETMYNACWCLQNLAELESTRVITNHHPPMTFLPCVFALIYLFCYLFMILLLSFLYTHIHICFHTELET
jgi:hypothetical protein